MRCFSFATEIGIRPTPDYDSTWEKQLAWTKVHKCTATPPILFLCTDSNQSFDIIETFPILFGIISPHFTLGIQDKIICLKKQTNPESFASIFSETMFIYLHHILVMLL